MKNKRITQLCFKTLLHKITQNYILIILLLFGLNFNSDLLATVRYVSVTGSNTAPYTSWADAGNDLQVVINYCSAGDTIWVVADTYQPAPGNSFIMKEGVQIYGGFIGTETSQSQRDWASNVTILLGNGSHVINNNANGLTIAAVLDGFTITGGSASAGGGMYNSVVSPMIANCNFTDNSADNGGGMYNNTSSPVLDNCIFEKDTTTFNGGGMYNIFSSKPNLSNCIFRYNSTNYGGGLLDELFSASTLTNCLFYQNHANNLGGGMCISLSSPNLSDCSFTENTANNQGGGIFSNNSQDTISGCTFTDNSSSNQGGGISYNNSQDILSDCIFTENTATNRGGGIYCYISQVSLDSCTFDKNSSNSGGGVYNDNATSNYTNCLFTENNANSNGGGVYNDNSTSNYTTCLFTENNANTDGGGFYCNNSQISLDSCTFEKNNGFFGGGGLFGVNSQINMSSCILSQNFSVSYGGGMHGQNLTGDITSCSFLENSAENGGGTWIYSWTNDTTNYINCTFSSNNATYGGGIYIGCPASITNCNFTENTATYGAGMFHSYYTSRLNNCTFTSNSATIQGGGVFEGYPSELYEKCIFYQNSAPLGGGVFSSNFASPNFSNCIFVENSASVRGGGLYNTYYNYPSITNSLFYGNTAGADGGAMANNNSYPTIHNSIIYNNSSGIFNNSSNPVIEYSLVQGLNSNSSGNIPGTTDPLFLNAVDPDGADDSLGTADDGISLTLCSPCKDAGNNSYVSDTLDLPGNPRIYNSETVDMGAYEFQSSNFLPQLALIPDPLIACDSQSVTLTATYQQGTNPAFTWYVNGLQVQSGSDSTYTTSSLADNDTVVVSVVFTECAVTFTDTAIADILPLPIGNASPGTQSICSGDTIQDLILSSNIPGTTYSWVRSDTAYVTGIPYSGSDSIISGSLTNTTYAPIDVIFTITPNSNGCDGATFTASVTVNPTPDATASPDSQTVCSGTPIQNIVISGNVSGTSFDWSRDNTINLTGIADTGSGDISGTLTNNTDSTQTTVFTIIPSANGCSGTPIIAVVTIKPTPDANVSIDSQTVCSNDSIIPILLSGSLSGTTFNWTRDNTSNLTGIPTSGSGDISGALTNTTYTLQATTFTVTPSLNGCDGIPVTSIVYVKPTPDATASSDSQFVCSGNAIQTITITGNVSGTSFDWTRDNTSNLTGIAASGSGDISGTITNNTDSTQSTIFTIIPSADGCTGSPIYVTVTVGPIPDGSASIDTQIVCSDDSIQAIVFSGSLSGTIFNWTRDNSVNLTGIAASGSGDISGALTNNTFTIQSTTFTITPSLNGCEGTPFTSTVDVKPSPDANATPVSQAICSGTAIQTIVLSGNVNGTTFNWTRDNTVDVTGIASSGSGDISGILTNTTSINQTTTFTITPTADGCDGTPVFASVTVKPIPDGNASIDSQTVCSGDVIQTISLSGSINGTVFNWTRDNTANLTGIAASGSGDIGGALINNTFILQSTTFTITPTLNGCDGTPFTSTVNVKPKPDASANPAAQTICSGNAIQTIVLSGNVSGTTFNWTRDNTSNVTGIANAGSGDISGTLNNNTNTIQITTFTIIPMADGCSGTPISAIVTVNPKPVATASPSTQSICSESTIQNIVLTSNVSGTIYSWTRNNTVNVTGMSASGSGSIISGSLTNNTFTIQVVTFTITPSANGCVGVPFTATVTVYPTPDVTATPPNQKICSGSAITPIIMSGNVSGTTYIWTRDMPSITGIANSGSGNISGTLTNNTGAPVTVTFTITPWANGCPGDPVTATVIVNPLPHATASATPNPVCAGELMWFSATGGIGYHWSGPNGFTFNKASFGRYMSPNMAGVYKVTVTSSEGCTSTASVTASVKPSPVPTISISPNPACTGNTVQFSASGGASYKWSGPNGFTSTQQNPTITNVKLYHSGTYSVTVTSANGCTASISSNLKVNETPVGKAWYDEKSSCMGSTLHLFATGGGTYQWSGPAGFSSSSQNPTRSNLNATHSGIYTVVITGLYGGCTSSYSVNVTVHPLPSVTAWTTTPEVCEGDAAYLFASGATSYKWSGPYGFSSNFQNPIIYNIPSYLEGIYTVTGSNSYGCTASASVFIDVQSVNAIVNATPNPVPYGGTLYLTASGGTFYQWTGPNGFHTTDQNPIIYKFTQVNAGLYSCIVSTSAGCEDTEIILVQVKEKLHGDPQVEIRSGKYIQVYPNPASASIRITSEYTGVMNYNIINVAGNIVGKGQTVADQDIDIQSLSSGSYYIQWTYVHEGKTESFISKFVRAN